MFVGAHSNGLDPTMSVELGTRVGGGVARWMAKTGRSFRCSSADDLATFHKRRQSRPSVAVGPELLPVSAVCSSRSGEPSYH